jgi:hypothetical protein
VRRQIPFGNCHEAQVYLHLGIQPNYSTAHSPTVSAADIRTHRAVRPAASQFTTAVSGTAGGTGWAAAPVERPCESSALSMPVTWPVSAGEQSTPVGRGAVPGGYRHPALALGPTEAACCGSTRPGRPGRTAA